MDRNKKSPQLFVSLSYLKIPKNTFLRRYTFEIVTIFLLIIQPFIKNVHLTIVNKMILNDIIQQCERHDRKAQNELFAHYAPILLSIALRYVKDHQKAEDVLVKSFYKVFTKINEFKGAGSFEGWMKKIVVNECLMDIRKNKNFSMTIAIDQVQNDLRVEWRDNLTYEEILSLLDDLPDGYRTVFNLYVIEGYKHREIADLLDISINTSKSQLILARRKLQSIIKKKLDLKLAV